MDDLTAFLKARLDEDEAAARDQRYVWPANFEVTLNPARVLREVKFGRRILELHEIHSEPTVWGVSAGAKSGQPTGGTTYWCDECDYDRDYGHIGSKLMGCPTLREYAAVWSDHPDYRPEWAP